MAFSFSSFSLAPFDDAGSVVPSYLRQRPAANRAWRPVPAGWAQAAQLRAIRGRSASTARPASPPVAPTLRVVRTCERPAPQPVAGRFALTGRLADVCAELDRLVAHEARAGGT